MIFISLITNSFRNLTDGETDLDSKNVVLVGENGQGKSNFLEALYYCSYASSFRGARDTELAFLGKKDFSLTAKTDGYKCSHVFKDEKKIISIDQKKITDRKELLEIIPSIIVCHEDMDFVTGSPERKRWFFDQTQSLVDALYIDDLRNYRKILKSRNTVLKNWNGSESTALLNAYDPQLVQYGFRLMEKRVKMAQNFSLIFEPLYREISGMDGVTVRYSPSWKHDNESGEISSLMNRRNKDIAFGASLSGPHRDSFIFSRNGKEFSKNASTGQRRLLALLLRIAQANIFSVQTEKKAVLLFDDVLLELDGEKRKRFISLMPDYEQAVYTFLPDEPYEKYLKDNILVYKMNNGALTLQNQRDL